MIPQTVENRLTDPSKATAEKLLADETAVFLVDWREEDDAIAEYCERILQTGSLSAEVVEIDDDPGFTVRLTFGDRTLDVPLVGGLEDRHITLLTLNKLLHPDYEIRMCMDSHGSDTLAFLPLPSTEWVDLETQFGRQ